MIVTLADVRRAQAQDYLKRAERVKDLDYARFEYLLECYDALMEEAYDLEREAEASWRELEEDQERVYQEMVHGFC